APLGCAERPACADSPPMLRSALLSDQPWLVHGFGTRACGLRHPRAGGAWMGLHPQLLMVKQIHSDLVWTDPAPGTPGDGMLTRQPGRLLALRTADCCPILIADTKRRAVAAVHAGWRGTRDRIVEKAVGEMRARWGSDPGDLVAAIGPGIRVCCYEVGAEVQQAFRARFAYADQLFLDDGGFPMQFLSGAPPGHADDARWRPASKLRLDLAQANARQLRDAGIPNGAVEIMPYCTVCQAGRFYSHRRGETGRMLSAIGIRSGGAC
ncbi:MAG: peptidoglycan editing factor PgeF, partial [Terriglobales bacterium]